MNYMMKIYNLCLIFSNVPAYTIEFQLYNFIIQTDPVNFIFLKFSDIKIIWACSSLTALALVVFMFHVSFVQTTKEKGAVWRAPGTTDI